MNSYWIENTTAKNYPKLENDIKTDVCIIGAGLVGITLAYLLHKNQEKNFVLLEKGKVLSGTTGHTTAKITSQHGLFYTYLIQSFGKEFAKNYLDSNEEAIYSIENIIKTEKINCDFEKQNAYIYTCQEKNIQKLISEVENVNALGLKAEFCKDTQLPFKTVGAVKFPNQAQFHPRKYVLSLLNLLPQNCIYENSKVYDIKSKNGYYKTYTTDGTITSKYVVIATHYPIINFPGFYFMKMYQDRSYVIGAEVNNELFTGMYLSQDEPVTSFRTVLDGNKRILLLGGAKHKSGDNNIELDKSYENLENYLKTLYPNAKVLYRWNTQDCITLDKIPYIGEYSNIMPNVFVATGFKKWGMTSSYVAAKIISDKILGNKNKYEKIYSSTRLKPIKNRKELYNMLKQTTYSLVLNKIKKPKVKFEDLKVGTGRSCKL